HPYVGLLAKRACLLISKRYSPRKMNLSLALAYQGRTFSHESGARKSNQKRERAFFSLAIATTERNGQRCLLSTPEHCHPCRRSAAEAATPRTTKGVHRPGSISPQERDAHCLGPRRVWQEQSGGRPCAWFRSLGCH